VSAWLTRILGDLNTFVGLPRTSASKQGTRPLLLTLRPFSTLAHP
jgi:hypothetical protein